MTAPRQVPLSVERANDPDKSRKGTSRAGLRLKMPLHFLSNLLTLGPWLPAPSRDTFTELVCPQRLLRSGCTNLAYDAVPAESSQRLPEPLGHRAVPPKPVGIALETALQRNLRAEAGDG